MGRLRNLRTRTKTYLALRREFKNVLPKTTFDLHPSKIALKRYEPKKVEIEGRKVTISKVPMGKASEIIEAIKKKIKEEPKRFALVGGRAINNLKLWKKGKVKNMFYLVARGEDGEILAVSSAKVLEHREKLAGLNYCTMAFEEGFRLGEIISEEKQHYLFDVMGVEEAYAIPETKAGRGVTMGRGYKKLDRKERHEWEAEFGVMVLKKEDYMKSRGEQK